MRLKSPKKTFITENLFFAVFALLGLFALIAVPNSKMVMFGYHNDVRSGYENERAYQKARIYQKLVEAGDNILWNEDVVGVDDPKRMDDVLRQNPSTFLMFENYVAWIRSEDLLKVCQGGFKLDMTVGEFRGLVSGAEDACDLNFG